MEHLMKTYIKNIMSKKHVNTKALNKALLLTVALIGLGCSSTEVGLQYYSLNSISAQPTSEALIANNDDNLFVVINNIEMADFLNTGGLVMQISSHQIHISNQHLWGDKLPKAIENHLISSMSNKGNNLYIEHNNSSNAQVADKHLTLYFDQFTVTNQHTDKPNETVISGSYVIENKVDTTSLENDENNKKRQRMHRRRNTDMESRKAFFDIRQPLTQDGYNHAVEKFKASLNRLSVQIEKDLTTED